MHNHRILAFALITGLTTTITSTAQTHGAHEHGKAQLNVALQGSVLEIELTSPANSFWGFEYSARTSTEKLAEQKALAQLKNGGWIALPSTAGCALKTSNAGHADDAEHAHEQSAAHSSEHAHDAPTHTDVVVTLKFDCTNSEALLQAAAIEMRLFQQFPNLSTINLQGITDAGQFAITLTAETPQFGLSLD
jgi:Protein of unknown function (DUF2796)